MRPPLDGSLDEPSLLEDAKVLGNRGQRHVVGRGQLADRRLAPEKSDEDVATRAVSEGGEGVIDRVIHS